MLRFDRVKISLGTRRWMFDTKLNTHGVYALLGRSGSGKSTFLNLIAGFLTPESGDIRWHDQSLLTLDASRRPVTTLFQQNNLFAHLNVLQNIGLGIDPGLHLSIQDLARIDKVLLDVGLPDYQKKRPPNLSGGEQQRVALARCLLRQRPILLLDEPFSALDATTHQEMTALLERIVKSYHPCVIMVTHDLDDAHALGAQILHIEEGAIYHQKKRGEA